MSRDNKKKIIIIKKVKKGHGGHHGGSWKVAYADFVTAMMAFFMVMWILGMDQQLKQAIEGYFSNPVGFKKGYSAGSSPLSSGASPAQIQTHAMRMISRQGQQEKFEETVTRIRTRLENSEGLGKLSTQIEIIITDAGLRIELVETGPGNTFFAFGSPSPNEAARHALTMIGAELRELSNPLVIEGHTDAAPYERPNYSNWELSTDRAHAARRTLEQSGVPKDRIREVRGLADRELRNVDQPYDPSNRRITIFLPFTIPPTFTQPDQMPAKEPGGASS